MGSAFRLGGARWSGCWGQVIFNQQDVTHLPMHRRARRGLGYLSQEPSIFRKLTVAENVMAILEMLPISADERAERKESLLDQLGIKRLANQMAYTLSGGERRRSCWTSRSAAWTPWPYMTCRKLSAT